MAFQKGNTFGASGRRKGSKNKTNSETKKMMKKFFDSNFVNAQVVYNKLTPVEQMRTLNEYAGYFMPKLKSVEQTIENVGFSSDTIERLMEVSAEKFKRKTRKEREQEQLNTDLDDRQN